MNSLRRWFCTVLTASVLLAVPARAIIDASLQMQLGNPSSATSDPANHAHYLIARAQYALDYSDLNGEPNWVSWDLTTADLGSSGRSPNFITDTTLPVGFYEVTTNDYTGSGYDRGHMCPSADRTITSADNVILFYLSNILPQAPDNNQGVWANFEGYCRTLAQAGNEVLITCGPSGFGGSRLPSGVAAIPGYVWKIAVVVPLGPGTALSRIDASTRVIAIKIPNIAGVRSDPWEQYVTSASQIEADTGFTFFTALPAAVANALRVKVDGQSAAGAPVITTQPVAQTTGVGGSASFTVTVSGNPPFSYQWLKDDVEIAGATDATLTLDNVQAGDAGNYYVVVTNAVGSTSSSPAALNISGLPPVVTTPPAAQTVPAGSNVTFAVVAGGSTPLTYQWRKDGIALGGATAAALSLVNVQAGEIGNYDVVVGNSVSTVTSAAALLTVNPAAPTITTQPVTKTVTGGTVVTFNVGATGTTPLTYQWRKGGLALANGGSVAGATTATLTLSGVTNADAGNYDCIVTNSINSVTSSAATLTVNAATIYWDFTTAAPTSGVPVDITGGTVTQGSNNGTTTLITTASVSSGYTGASGGGNAGLAARIGALNKAANGSAYFEFTLTPAAGEKLVATAISFGTRSTSTGPQAYSIFTSFDGFLNPVATGTVLANSNYSLQAPAFTAVTGTTGAAVTFRIYGFNGTGSAGANTANWRIDDLKLTVSTLTPSSAVAPTIATTSPLAGANSVPVSTPITIVFSEPANVASGWFTITSASNGPIAATVIGGPISFTLNPPANFAYGDTITVNILASQVTDKDTGTLNLPANYSFSFSTGLPVAPGISSQPQSLTVTDGGSASFTVGATGTTPLTYQWRKNTSPIAGNGSATTATLSLPGVTLADAGSYDCVVTNTAGSATSNAAALTVNPAAPSITSQPAGKTVTVGGSASFTVAVSGTAPFSYQWRKNGAPLADAGSVSGSATPTLTLTGVTAGSAGSYDVVVTNSVTSVTSSAAVLGVTSATLGAVYWDFTTASPTSGLPADVTGGTVTQGNNNGTTALLTTTSAANGYTGASGGNNAGAAARTGALNQAAGGSAYFEFTLTPATGKQLVATAISFGTRSTGTGPAAFGVFTSVDNFTTPVATGAITPTSGSSWGPSLKAPGFSGVRGAVGAPVTFRLYGYNGTGSPGANTANWRIDDLSLTLGTELPPAVAGTVPAAGATNVAISSPVTITFNQAVNVTNPWFSISSSAHGAVAATASGGPVIFTLTPAANFVTSDTVTVTVFAAAVTDQASGTLHPAVDYSFPFTTAAPIVIPPAIVTPPVAQTVTVGDTASFTVAASGTMPLGYQWRKGGTNITGNSTATTDTLTLAGVTTTDAASYDCVVTNSAGSATSNAVALTVNKAAATVTLAGLSATYDGSPKAVTATTSQPGLAVDITYNGSSTPPTAAGSYPVSAVINDPNYSGSAGGVLMIGQAGATVTLGNLSQTYDGSPKAASVTTDPAGLTVTVTYDGNATAPANAGSYAVVATVSEANYQGSATDTLVIAKADQAITFNPVPGVTYGDTPFAVTASASSGLDVSFSVVSGPATISGSTVTITGAGPVVVRAAQAGDANHNPATDVDQSFTVGKANQAITFAPISGATFGDTPFAVTATSSSSLGVSFSIVSGPATISGSTVTITGTGPVVVRAAQAGDANYNPAPDVDQTFTVGKANQTIAFAALPERTFGNAPFTVSATTSSGLPAGFSVIYGPATVSGNTVTITGAGTVTVRAAQAGNDNYNPAPNADQSFTVAKATLTATAQSVSHTYGAANPALTVAYSGFVNGDTAAVLDTPAVAATTATAGSDAGTYAITVGGGVDDNYAFSYVSGTLTITPAGQTISFGSLANHVFGDASFTVGATASSGLPVSFSVVSGPASVSGNAVTLTGAGTVTLRASQGGSLNYAAAAAVDQGFTVAKGAATVAIGNLSQAYTGAPKTVSVTTNPAGLAVNVTYNGGTAAPAGVGSYAVVATISDANYAGSASATLTITNSSATIALSNLFQVYDGTPQPVTVTTVPAGLNVTVTYDGIATVPTLPGSHTVVATITSPGYSGTASGTLVIGITALVRHAPTLNGDVDGSIQVLSAEATTLNGSASVSGDLLVPGLPTVKLNGQPVYAGTIDGTGAATPSNYQITLNGGAVLRHVRRRTDAITMPVVSAPPAPAGTRDATLNSAGQSAGSFATLRNLTLNGNVGVVAVPPGTYGSFLANGGSGFALGVAGATTPAVYNLQALTLNGNSQLQILGPVLLTLANGPTLNGAMGSTSNPEWLALRVFSGGLTLNGNITFNGSVTAPNGTIIINGNSTVNGEVACDRLTLNGNGLLHEVP